MTREELAEHQGPVWVVHTQERAVPISDWKLADKSHRVLLNGLLAFEDCIFPTEQACLEELIRSHMQGIKTTMARIDKIKARLAELAGGVDKGI